MRTAIYVYRTTSLHISTCESNLELCGMTAATLALSRGESTTTIDPGIYKIVSSEEVSVTGDPSALDIVVSTNVKDNDPTTPPRASQSFAPLNMSALQAFLADPDAKALANP